MAKITKKAEMLERLHGLVEKEKAAQLAQTNISGVPGTDTEFQSVSEDTEHTDKNGVGPEKLNDEQRYKQEASKDEAEPSVAKQGSVSNVDKVAADILESIKTKLALAQTNISGVPGKDTKIQAVSEDTENTDKNGVGPEKLNDEQKYKQEASKDEAEPSIAKAGSEAEKQASYNLGKAFCEALLQKAAEIKQASEKDNEKELLKEAGRRDLDTIIAQAEAELEMQKQAAFAEKVAEEQGAAAFDSLYKQAQIEFLAEQNQTLQAKVASFEEIQKVAAAKEEAARKEQESIKLAELISSLIKRELASSTPASK